MPLFKEADKPIFLLFSKIDIRLSLKFLIIFKDVSSDPSSIIINSKFENVCFKILPIASSKNFSPL